MDSDGFKICPFCKEKIRKEAVKCRYCGEWLEQEEQTHIGSDATGDMPPPLPIQHESPALEQDKNRPVIPPPIEKRNPPKTIVCPNCRLVNPPDAVHCDCGYNFSPRKLGGNIQKENPRHIFNWIGAILLAVCGPNKIQPRRGGISCLFFR